MANRAERRRAVRKAIVPAQAGMSLEALRQKAKEYRQQAEIAQLNFHRLSGAAIAYEEIAKGLETAQSPPLSLVKDAPDEPKQEEKG